MKKSCGTLFIILVLLSACVKTNNDPGCSVNGTWMGRWDAGTQEGTWVCNAQNNSTNLSGYVFIWFDMPKLENHGIGFDGLIRDRQVSSKEYISETTLNINGNVETDSSASGSFSVSIGMSGTWQGVKLPELNLSVVDSFPLNIQFPYGMDIACDTERKHLFVISGKEVKEYSYTGNEIRTFSADYSGPICFDGNHLWYSDFDKAKVIEVDTFGNWISDFTNTIGYSDGIMYDSGNLTILSDYSRKMFTVSKTGTPISELSYSYTNISGICRYQNGCLVTSGTLAGTLFSVNSAGVPEKAYKFSNGYCYGLTRDGEYLWCAVVRYISTSSNPPSPPITDVKLFKLKINS